MSGLEGEGGVRQRDDFILGALRASRGGTAAGATGRAIGAVGGCGRFPRTCAASSSPRWCRQEAMLCTMAPRTVASLELRVFSVTARQCVKVLRDSS